MKPPNLHRLESVHSDKIKITLAVVSGSIRGSNKHNLEQESPKFFTATILSFNPIPSYSLSAIIHHYNWKKHSTRDLNPVLEVHKAVGQLIGPLRQLSHNLLVVKARVFSVIQSSRFWPETFSIQAWRQLDILFMTATNSLFSKKLVPN